MVEEEKTAEVTVSSLDSSSLDKIPIPLIFGSYVASPKFCFCFGELSFVALLFMKMAADEILSVLIHNIS